MFRGPFACAGQAIGSRQAGLCLVQVLIQSWIFYGYESRRQDECLIENQGVSCPIRLYLSADFLHCMMKYVFLNAGQIETGVYFLGNQLLGGFVLVCQLFCDAESKFNQRGLTCFI